MIIGSEWGRGGNRLVRKLLLHPGGRPELDLDDSKQSDSSQMNFGEKHGAKHCTETIHLSRMEGGQAPGRLCVCVGGLTVVTISF